MPWPVRYAVFAAGTGAGAGGVLVGAGVLWLVFSSGVAAYGGAAVLLRLAGPAGVALTTASLGGLYALLMRRRSGSLPATVGALAALTSLVALIWLLAHQPPFASPVADDPSGGPPPFLAVAAVTVAWVRPVGILLFGVAALLTGAFASWRWLLFVLGVLETPLLGGAVLYLFGPTPLAGWPVLLFGLPGVQPGLLGAAAWMLLGYALSRSGGE